MSPRWFRVTFTVAFAATFLGCGLQRASADPKGRYVLCKNAGVVRTLRVCQNGADGVFRVLYTKNGQDEIKASGRSYEFNVKKLESIQETLEEANWKCRNVSSAAVHVGGGATSESANRAPASAGSAQYVACQ